MAEGGASNGDHTDNGRGPMNGEEELATKMLQVQSPGPLGLSTGRALARHRRRVRSGRRYSAPPLAHGLAPFSPRGSLSSLFGPRLPKKVEWYEFIENVYDYEEAWSAFQDNLTDSLFEGLAIPVPYLHDGPFYNLNAVVLEQRATTSSGVRVFNPSGPLRRLCSAVTAKTYEQVCTSKASTIGPWFSSSHAVELSAKHNGVQKKIELSIGNIYRSASDDLAGDQYRVNMNALMAISDPTDIFDGDRLVRSPLEDDVFLGIDHKKASPASVYRSTPLRILSPISPSIATPTREKVKCIYVIHELIHAESLTITIRIGKSAHTYQPPMFLVGKRAFPIGFTLTKYDIREDGFLEKKEVLRGTDLSETEWNMVENVPWPPKPPDPTLLVQGTPTPSSTSGQVSPPTPTSPTDQTGTPNIRTYDTDGYRKRAAAVCLRDGNVLLVSGKTEDVKWTIPGGGVEPEEDTADTALRELSEEAGVNGEIIRQLGVFGRSQQGVKNRTTVYLVRVLEEHPNWKEAEEGRKRVWVPFDEARELLAQNKPWQVAYLDAVHKSSSVSSDMSSLSG